MISNINKKRSDLCTDQNTVRYEPIPTNKRGQITVFILIGLVLIIIIGLTAYFSQSLYVKKLFLDKDLAPVIEFAETCVKEAAEQGVFLAGMQGGYITLPEVLDKDPFASLNNGFKVPFWYYRYRDYMPSTSDVEYQLVTFVNNQVAGCINNFDSFKNQYDFSSFKGLYTKVKITDSKVAVTTMIPTTLKLKSTESSSSFKKLPHLTVDVKTSFGSMFNLARSIMVAENEQGFLEELTDDMIAVSPDVPYKGMEMTCEPRSWTTEELKEHIKKLILYNLRYLHFEGAQYIKTNIPYYEKQYNYKVTPKKYSNLLVNVIYDPAWDFDLEVSPSKNNIVKPIEYTASELLFTCFKIYNHHYSYQYPMMFQIINSQNPEEEFYFATPVMVKRNLPNRKNEVPFWPSELTVQTNSEYCSQGLKEVTDYNLAVNGSITTAPKKVAKQTNRLSIFVYNDDPTKQGNLPLLSGANISYQCVNVKCPIGATDYPRVDGKLTGAEPMLTSLFPDCENGLLITEKDGYLTAYQQQSVNPETDNFNVNINMKQTKLFNVKVKVVEDRNGFIEERDLKQDEHVFIRIENKPLYYEQQFVYPSELLSSLPLVLDTVTYDLDIKLFNEQRLLGGAELSWQPDLEQLQYRGGIIFYVYTKQLPSYETDVKKQQQSFEFAIEESKKYQPRLTLS